MRDDFTVEAILITVMETATSSYAVHAVTLFVRFLFVISIRETERATRPNFGTFDDSIN